MLLATIADWKTAASWGEGKKNCKNSPRARFWMGPNWVGPWALAERCLIIMDKAKKPQRVDEEEEAAWASDAVAQT